jgi:urease accessory protein
MTDIHRAVSHLPAKHGRGTACDSITLAHDERRLRRKVLALSQGGSVLVDFPQAVTLDDGGALVLEDGRLVEIVAASEALYRVTGRDAAHLVRLAWHLGNRHLPAQLAAGCILVRRDHVIRDMLAGLGAGIVDVEAAFFPEHGAYHAHGPDHHALLNR